MVSGSSGGKALQEGMLGTLVIIVSGVKADHTALFSFVELHEIGLQVP